MLRAIVESFRPFWSRGRAIERLAYVAGVGLLASGLIHVGVLVARAGSWTGPVSLRKPATFGLSFGLTLITISWVSSFLRVGLRARAGLLATFAAACVLETALVSLQAWRGVPSHFNMETPFDLLVTRLLAGGGVLLVAIVTALTILSFRSNAAIPASLRLAIRTGFAALLGSMVTGALMIAKGVVLVGNGEPQAAYATGGFLKPTHAVTMHAILVLPLLAWLLSLTRWSERRQFLIALLGVSGYVLFAGVVAVANLSGISSANASVAVAAPVLAGLLVLIAAYLMALAGVAGTGPFDFEQRFAISGGPKSGRGV